MTTAHETVSKYWTICDARDWAGFAALLAEDVVYDLPQPRQRINGRDAFVRFNVEYPGDWHVTVERVVGEGSHAASWVRVALDGEDLPALSFFEFDDAGLIVRITEFWPEPYDPPAGREHLAENY
ncbi:nuclear transport factor 2 family protein [Plantactinospora solaniradicis]|uniref:Nuclear transport factor 2 family protein n=1 Tax=Plantactinospora solaniradicis TaxID=1723736 RepID=A0ABW1KH08_9ACTN